MKNLKLILLGGALTLTGLLYTSCDNSSSTAEKKIEETSEAVTDIFRSEQEELLADLRETQADISGKIENLETSLSAAMGEDEIQIRDRMVALNKWRNQIEEEIKRVEEASLDNWESLKSEINQTIDDAEKVLEGTYAG